MKTVGWVDSREFDRHVNDYGHPERPERLTAVREGLAALGLESRLVRAEAPPVSRALLERVHHPRYVAALEDLCARGGGRLDADTTAVPASWTAAQKAAGAVTLAVSKVVGGEWNRAFCSVRPRSEERRVGKECRL